MNTPPDHILSPVIRTVPRWFERLTQWGLTLLRPVLPSRWLLWLQHIAWFLVVGVFNTLIGYVVFYGLLLVGVPSAPALALTYLLGIFIAYHNFSSFVFHGGTRAALLRFICAYGLLYLCNLALLAGLQRWSGWSAELIQLLLLPVIAALSYLLNRALVLKNHYKSIL